MQEVIARTTLGRILVVCLSVAVSQAALPAQAAVPAAHIVAHDEVAHALVQDAASRVERVRAVQAALDSPAVRGQAGLLGLDAARMRAAVPHLSDHELADLSQRAKGLKDLTAGHSTDDGLVILGIVLLLAGLIVLAAVAYDDYYDDCYCY
jgi:hypothetical protein